MSSLQALLLGILQGLTEFLPISSSGHLVIAQHLLNLSKPPIIFDIIVHVGTLLAIIIYFLPRLKQINLRLLKLVLIGTIPAVIVGLFLNPFLEVVFSSLTIVAIGLFVTSALLAFIYFLSHQHLKLDQLSLYKAFLIGLFQALAIIPGISRSGSTVFASLQSGLKKEDSFYFSFLLAIPAIIGALTLQLFNLNSTSNFFSLSNAIGFISSAITSYFALRLLKLVIIRAKLHYFSIYCFSLSLLLFISSIIL